MVSPLNKAQMSLPTALSFGDNQQALSLNQLETGDSIQFGSSSAATDKPEIEIGKEKESFFQQVWKEMKGPYDLSFGERFTAFFSKTNLSHGMERAKLFYNGKEKKGFEIVFMLAETLLAIFLMGISLVINMGLPGVAISETLGAFYLGVHESAEAAKQANSVEDKEVSVA